MSVFQGDFLGFQLGDEHSYNLNITRVSTNDRYQDDLLPNFTDATAQVPGGDGTYYWDSYYTQKPFTINFAFDDLRDEDIRALRQSFGFKGIKPLIFDEYPYKKYMVKCVAPPQLRYICFDHLEFRIYKGEGTVQLMAYYPFAFSTVSPYIPYVAGGAPINNVGDLPANMELLYNINDLQAGLQLKLKDSENLRVLGYLNLAPIPTEEVHAGDMYILINTRTQLIEGLDASKKKTAIVYNKYIESGDFFQPPVGRSYLVSDVRFINATYTPMYY